MAMASETEKKNRNEEEEEEPKIPVFTVLKNGAILKNIFIVGKPPPPPHSKPISSFHHQETQEEILIVGRHPDCNIVLTHPSISRFHLQILSNPCSQTLSLTDLSSVHGTWVSDMKIEPGVRAELNEGDTLRVGGSSRVYSLHWIPLSRAYNFEAPFQPLTKHEEEEDEDSQELEQGGNSLSVENKEIESLDSNSKAVESLFSDDFLGLGAKSPLALPMPNNWTYTICDESEGCESSSEDIGEENKFSNFWAFGTESVNLFLNTEECNNPNPMENDCLQLVQVPEETRKQSPLCKDHVKNDTSCLSASPLVVGEVLGETKNQLVEEGNLIPELKANSVNMDNEHPDETKEEACPAARVPEETRKRSPLSKDHVKNDTSCLSTSPVVIEVLGETKKKLVQEGNLILELKANSVNLDIEHADEINEEACLSAQEPEEANNQRPRPLGKDHGQVDGACLLSEPLVVKTLFLLKGEVLGEDKDEPSEYFLVNLNVDHFDEKEGNVCQCHADGAHEKSDNQSPFRKELAQIDISCPSSGPLLMEDLSLPIEEVLGETEDQRVAEESLTPEPKSNLLIALNFEHLDESGFCESPLRSENKISIRENFWERRGKPASVVQIQTDKSRGKTTEAGYNDDFEQEKEVFEPDKENFTPNSLGVRPLSEKGKVEVKHSKSSRLSSSSVSNIHEQDVIISPQKEKQKLNEVEERKSVGTSSVSSIHEQDAIVSPQKEKQKLKEVEERKSVGEKVRRERMPQSLKDGGSKKISYDLVPEPATKRSPCFSYTQTKHKKKSVGVGKRRVWTMIADTNTLLDKESRKSLQLLQGLWTTCLIIPRMVIQELDSLKQHGRLFGKRTKACLALEWIEDCMVKTNWWINVQSPVEDGRLIAPSPPVSPLPGSQCRSDKSWGFFVSPAAQDLVLDCALLHREIKNDGQLVLLSNDVTLKIKAMAEGFLCETTQEFHESLVNPSSERFMWPDSSPHGSNWFPLNKLSKGEAAKGLKLILLHNSHYRKRQTIE